MGLFGFNKKFDICPKEKELQGLVINYNSKVGRLKINAKLVVPKNYYFVIGKRGKVADQFQEGEHFFNFSNLPYMCRKFGIDKVKDGKKTDKISADLYFVSKDLFAGKFKTYRKVEMGTKAYGMFKAGVFGVYSYKINEVREFMQSLLNVYDFIKTGEAEDIVESWVNELVVRELEKKNYILPDVIANNPIITENLKIAVGKLFSTAGLELVEFKILGYKLPKQYQEESDKVMNEKSETQDTNAEQKNSEESNDEIDIAEKIIQEDIQAEIDNQQINAIQEIIKESKQEELSLEIKEENNSTIKEQEYVPFGNFAFGLNQELKKENVKQKPERSFVDLNVDKLYHNDEPQTKRCLNCGAENNENANHCVLCGEKFN